MTLELSLHCAAQGWAREAWDRLPTPTVTAHCSRRAGLTAGNGVFLQLYFFLNFLLLCGKLNILIDREVCPKHNS